MTHILSITSSLSGEASQSSRLAERFLARAKAAEPGLAVTRRDLGRDPVPALDPAELAAFALEPAARPPEAAARIAFADALIEELRAAEVVLIAAPMYNFGVPAGLKNWFDQVARAGVTFRYTAAGPVGLLTGRRAVLVTTRGGRHRDTPADHVVPYVRTMLAFLGIRELEVVYAEGLAIGAGERLAGLAAAEAQIDELTARAA